MKSQEFSRNNVKSFLRKYQGKWAPQQEVIRPIEWTIPVEENILPSEQAASRLGTPIGSMVSQETWQALLSMCQSGSSDNGRRV